MATVDIYLPIESTDEWIHALAIPHTDIKRLALRPLKWLRFAIFTVCGAKGHLSTTKGGARVDYETDSFDNLEPRYYYTPDSEYHLVDYQVFNDRCTSSVLTLRRSDFRRDICGRDHVCVVTQTAGRGCDAAHIIPRSKGSEYITSVVRDRSSLYEHLPFSLEREVDIDCTENGILLRKDLHWGFSSSEVVFLKTPNFAMVPEDVPRVEEGPIPDNRTTLQHIVEPTGRNPVEPWDVLVDWRDEVHPPPSILLDFMYGAAIVNRWQCDRLRDMLDERFRTFFDKVGAKNPKRPVRKDDESEVEPNDSTSSEWEPSEGSSSYTSYASKGLPDAMDRLLLLPSLLKGITPEMMAAKQEKRLKEEELCFQEQGRERVQEWLDPMFSSNACCLSEGTNY